MPAEDGRVWRVARALAPVRREELAPALWSAGLFFCALGSFYVLRPVREEVGVASGVEQLPWMFTTTFVVMLAAVPLYSWVVARLRRQVFIPLVYRLCAAVLLAFFAALTLVGDASQPMIAKAFFVWIAVFNLMVVSVFWELMADVWSREESARLFGLVAAGGSAGALAGPLVTALLVPRIGVAPLLLVSVACLEGALLCARRLERSFGTGPRGQGHRDMSKERVGGGALAAFAQIARSPRLAGLALFVALMALSGTFAYLEQAKIVKAAIPDPAERTQLFATVDFVVSAISVAMQGLAVGRLIPAIGVGWVLAALPVVALLGFAALAAAPLVATIVGFQIVRRAAEFSLAKPAREVLFTMEGREAKYKAKHLIDTAVYRGGDLVGAWSFHGLAALGLGVSGLAAVGAVIGAPWIGLALLLGRTGANGQGATDRSEEDGQSPANT